MAKCLAVCKSGQRRMIEQHIRLLIVSSLFLFNFLSFQMQIIEAGNKMNGRAESGSKYISKATKAIFASQKMKEDESKTNNESTTANESSESKPTLEQTMDFIIGKLNGHSATLNTPLPAPIDRCHPGTKTDRFTYEANPDKCKLKITVKKYTSTEFVCDFGPSNDEYTWLWAFDLDLSKVTLDSIKVKDDSGFFYADLNLSVPLSVNESTAENHGSGWTNSPAKIITWPSERFMVGDQDTAERLGRALQHAVTLCGGKKDLF